MDEQNAVASDNAAAERPMPRAVVPGRARRRALLVATSVFLVGLLMAAAYWYTWSLRHETTDNAQVEGHVHAVASRVAGYVAEVCVRDNQVVSAGEVLVRLRASDYEARVRLAEANLAQAEAQAAAAEHALASLRRATEAGIAQARAAVDRAEAQRDAARHTAAQAQAAWRQAQAQAVAAEADADYAEFNRQRILTLYQRAEAAETEAKLADATARSAAARVAAAQEAVQVAEAQAQAAQVSVAVAEAAAAEARGKLEERLTGPDDVKAAEARLALAQAAVKSARAQLDLARLDLEDCTIRAPATGVVSKRSVEAGQFVQPGQSILAIVPLDTTWVVANFKETQLRHMRVGQRARLRVDAYPDHPFEGVVESFAAGTGARFSLLPPENATGNYVKVVQRVPVKIVLMPGQRDPQRPLRAGMNVVVTVNTSERPGNEAPDVSADRRGPA